MQDGVRERQYLPVMFLRTRKRVTVDSPQVAHSRQPFNVLSKRFTVVSLVLALTTVHRIV